MDDLSRQNEKRRTAWAKQAADYDKRIGFFERRVFGPEHRSWACSRAEGDTLEVAVGTGLNLPLYRDDVRLTGIDLTAEMIEIARERAGALGRDVTLQVGDAHSLAFPDASFDSVVCTYSLCNIPDPARAVGEMKRVLRPDGRLILVDHIRSSVTPFLWLQKAFEFFSVRSDGDHMTRRPLEQVVAHGFEIVERDRLGPGGIVERLVATSP
ncbi:MAG TPA: class I SAM-dependent methyltransferase [Actinomycetota bacterium]|nr:class I SAM-dependent methyltransferase [Actinomycetota bacterium]